MPKVLSFSEIQRVEFDSKKDARGEFKKMNLTSLTLGNKQRLCFATNPQLGTLRGLHFQYPPTEEVKVVYCISGALFDVAVDLRRSSPTFGDWSTFTLSAESNYGLLIPAGFAHGYQTLRVDTIVGYVISGDYQVKREGRVNPLDEDIGIAWPQEIKHVSRNDSQAPRLQEIVSGLR